MAALPYMQLYVADYLADTIHLETDEHGAYLLIIMNYWQTGKPVPVSRLQKISRLTSERWSVVEQTLLEFFNIVDDCWFHERIEYDLEKVNAKCKSASLAGKKSAAKRAAQALEKSGNSNERSTQSKQSLNHTDTNTKKKQSSVDDGQFKLFWSNYPKKVDKKQAEAKFNRLTKTKQNLAITDCLERYKDTPKQFVPSPRKYIIGEKWNDEPINNTGQNNGTHKKSSTEIFDEGTKDAYSQK